MEHLIRVPPYIKISIYKNIDISTCQYNNINISIYEYSWPVPWRRFRSPSAAVCLVDIVHHECEPSAPSCKSIHTLIYWDVAVLIIDISMCWYIDIWQKLGILCLVDISMNCYVDTLLYWLMYCIHMLIRWCVAVLICWYTDVVVSWYCHVREHKAPMLDR